MFFPVFFPVGEKISSYKDITNYPTKIDPPILGWIFLPSHNQAPKTHKNTTHLRKSPQKKWWPNYNPITNKRFTRVNCLVIWHPSRRRLARLHFLSKWKMQRGGEWWSWLEWNGSGGSGIISTSHGLVDVKWQRLNLYFTVLTSKSKKYGLEDGHNNPRVPHSSSGGVIQPCAQFASRSHDPTVDINSWNLSGTLNIAT
jgi:hypothetical protein